MTLDEHEARIRAAIDELNTALRAGIDAGVRPYIAFPMPRSEGNVIYYVPDFEVRFNVEPTPRHPEPSSTRPARVLDFPRR